MVGSAVELKGFQSTLHQEEAPHEYDLLRLGWVVDQEFLDNLPEEEIYKAIKLVGFVPPSGMIAVFPEEGVRAVIEDFVPADFVKDVRSISYRENGSNNDTSSLGECVSRLDSDRNIITDISIFQSPFLPEGSTEDDVLTCQGLVSGTLLHEIGENVFLHLTLEEIEGWGRVVAVDQTAVTSFVDDARRQSRDKGNREDFCEAFQMFTKIPSVLWVLSESRYRYMFELFLNHLPSCRKEVFRSEMYSTSAQGIQHFNRSGLSPEKIREYYLGD